ncbi:MAG: hypothetical protein M1813_007966 [Trichoglossum hirsutum]|nr:MAG: hypothetical protein M1813_007966 [Trichoglossum hirsutum]
MSKIILVQLALLCVLSAAGVDEGWFNVTYTDVYGSLAQCARDCVLNVNQVNDCYTYSCVCSENTGGANFNDGVKNITECAKRSCSNSQDADNAVIAFRDLCIPLQATRTSSASKTPTVSPRTSSLAVPSASATSLTSSTLISIYLIKSRKYSNLNACSKFCVNSCRNVNGAVSESQCGSTNKPEGWEEYKGLANQLGCSSAECVCTSGAFNITFGKLYQTGVKYCNLLPSTADLPVPEYNRLQEVLADYCTDNGFRPDGWYLEVEGRAPGTKPKGTGLSGDSKITLGVGLCVGMFGLALQTVSTCFSWKTYRRDREYRRTREAN